MWTCVPLKFFNPLTPGINATTFVRLIKKKPSFVDSVYEMALVYECLKPVATWNLRIWKHPQLETVRATVLTHLKNPSEYIGNYAGSMASREVRVNSRKRTSEAHFGYKHLDWQCSESNRFDIILVQKNSYEQILIGVSLHWDFNFMKAELTKVEVRRHGKGKLRKCTKQKPPIVFGALMTISKNLPAS